MEAAGENRRLRSVLMGGLLAAALETAPDVHRVVKLEAVHLLDICLLWHRRAAADQCEASVAIEDMVGWQTTVGPADQRDAG